MSEFLIEKWIVITSLSVAATWKENSRSGKNRQPRGTTKSMQMKAVQNVNKVLCLEYNSLDTNWY